MFALGCIVYEVVTRRKLFVSDIALWVYYSSKNPLILSIWPDCVVGSTFHGLGRMAHELVEIEVSKRPGAAEVGRKLELLKGSARGRILSFSKPEDPGNNALENEDEDDTLAIANRQARQPFEAVFTPLYANSSGTGIGGYDLRDHRDRAFEFDYSRSGIPDHIVLYRPGTGILWILKNDSGNFEPVYKGGHGNGIGGYDLASPNDRVFTFDYEHSGKLDYLVFYRPGTGMIWILRNEGGKFAPVYKEGCGIGGYDLSSSEDRAFAFDFEHNGLLDHLVLYRHGIHTMTIVSNNNGIFTAEYSGPLPQLCIDDSELNTQVDWDRAFAFDYHRSGRQDHIFLYQRDQGRVCILQNQDGIFTSVYFRKDFDGGICLHPFSFGHIFPYDYEGRGKADHLVFYGPGSGHIEIIPNDGNEFIEYPVYGGGEPSIGRGIGGYDLNNSNDRLFPFAYFPNGKASQICLYRPGHGTFWILRRF